MPPVSPIASPAPALVGLSAPSSLSLAATADRLAAHLLQTRPKLEDVATTLAIGREHLPYRWAAVVTSLDELIAGLAGGSAVRSVSGRCTGGAPSLVVDGSDVPKHELQSFLAVLEDRGARPMGTVIGPLAPISAVAVTAPSAELPDRLPVIANGPNGMVVGQAGVDASELAALVGRAGVHHTIHTFGEGRPGLLEVLTEEADQVVVARLGRRERPSERGALVLVGDDVLLAVADLWSLGVPIDLCPRPPGRRLRLPGTVLHPTGLSPDHRAPDPIVAAVRTALDEARVRLPLRDTVGAVALQQAIRRRLGCAPDLAEVAAPGVGDLVARVRAIYKAWTSPRRTLPGHRPLTPFQQRLLYFDLVRVGPSCDSNIGAGVVVDGHLDPPTLTACFRGLLRRRPSVSARVVSDGERWSALDGAPATMRCMPSPVARVDDLITIGVAEPFDLRNEVLLRGLAAQSGPRQFNLVLVAYRGVVEPVELQDAVEELAASYQRATELPSARISTPRAHNMRGTRG